MVYDFENRVLKKLNDIPYDPYFSKDVSGIVSGESSEVSVEDTEMQKHIDELVIYNSQTSYFSKYK